MYPKPLKRLIDAFMHLPGIGPRQATRFAFFILKQKPLLQELTDALNDADTNVAACTLCFRTMTKEKSTTLCSLCRDQKRDKNTIAIVEKESDMKTLEATGAYRGVYHVLGGVVSPLDPESPKRLHLTALYKRTETLLKKEEACEVILATNSTTEGDTTALYLTRVLEPLKEKYPDFKISRLGRGLSLGAELEFTDEITLKNALKHRI